MSGEQVFDAIVRALAKGDVEPPDPSRRAFGSNALRVKGKIFAMMVRGLFVVKLPKARVDALVSAELGRPFEPAEGRVMREWIAIDGHEKKWPALAEEALAFARATKPKPKPKKRAASRS